jgi:hypothetical protein
MLLALLPAIVLAAPTWDKIEYVYTPKDTLAETKVTVYNTMPVEVSLYMTHMRGDNGDTKGAHRWDYGPAGDTMDGYYPLTFETSTFPTFNLQSSQLTLSSQEGLGQMAGRYSVSRSRLVHMDGRVLCASWPGACRQIRRL